MFMCTLRQACQSRKKGAIHDDTFCHAHFNTNAWLFPFLTQLQEAAIRHGHPEATALEMIGWCRRFILFHGKKHPQEMGQTEAGLFLDHVAKTEELALRAIAAARGALEFVYTIFLQRELGELPWPRPPKLLDQVTQVLRVKHYARTTEECYVQWIRRFILFHDKRHRATWERRNWNYS